ncbi:MAG TPA: hypothetical protein VKZ50_00740 [bacterium]|nr:hypothetical protein [bacterium]
MEIDKADDVRDLDLPDDAELKRGLALCTCWKVPAGMVTVSVPRV